MSEDRLVGAVRRLVASIGERSRAAASPVGLPALRGTPRIGAATTIGVLVYRGVSSNEIEEPVERLAERLQAAVVFVGAELGSVHAVEPSRRVIVDYTPRTAPHIDVLVVPGGLGWKQVIDDSEIRNWLSEVAASARGIMAISTGSLLLASVGRLEGRQATGHWLATDELAALGATVTSARTATDDAGCVVTASGVLAAIQVVDGLADHARWAEWRP